MKAGVLALQGDFREHAAMFAEAGATPVLVRTPEDLAAVDCLAIPGGESTTISKLARRFDLVEPIRDRAATGMPVFGTCAGMIVMATEVDGGEPLLSILDIRVVRNAYGRQVDSFEATVDVARVGPVRAVFIRAPQVARVGDGVEVLAEHAGVPVLVRQGRLLAAAFHPEIAGDPRLHRAVLESAVTTQHGVGEGLATTLHEVPLNRGLANQELIALDAHVRATRRHREDPSRASAPAPRDESTMLAGRTWGRPKPKAPDV